MRTLAVGFAGALALCAGCSSARIEDKPQDDEPASGGEGPIPVDDPETIELVVGPDARSFVELQTPTPLELDGDGSKSVAWDFAIQGRDVFTNGGISGPGNSSAFGPLSAPTYLSDTAPEVPLLLKDRAGGAFIDWYDYGGEDHLLFSRYHVYALRDGDRYYKLQILSYYGERLGAPVPALYRIRYALVDADGASETRELMGIDATAGGSKDDDSAPSTCVDFDAESSLELLPDEAAERDDWHLCFRREGIAVNGGLSGPRGVEAVDLQAADTASEVEAEVQKRTEGSELPRFDAVGYAEVTDESLDYRADGVVTAFGSRWLEPGSDPLAVSDAVWLVLGADGVSKYLLQFRQLSGDPATEQATLRLRAKSVR